MPLYEYQCEVCGHRFEVIQKYADAPIDTCPRCNGVVRKLFSSPAIQFKGTGWYVTDYARAGKSDPGASGASSAKSDSGGAESKGDSKSESKSDTKSDAKSESKTESKSETKSDTKSDAKPSTS
jgi:putative FmdB family regulatory protein